MRPGHELIDGIKLTTIALVAAILTASAVIGVGRMILPQATPVHAAERSAKQSSEEPLLIALRR